MTTATEKKNEYVCRVPDCERVFEHAGARNLHERKCKIAAYDKMNAEKKQNVDQVELETCSHKWRMLRGDFKNEKMAINAGYRKVCNVCLTLV